MIQWLCALFLLEASAANLRGNASAANVRGNPFWEIQSLNEHHGYANSRPVFTRGMRALPVRRQAPQQSMQPPEFVPMGKRRHVQLQASRVLYSLGAGTRQIENVAAVLSTWGQQVAPNRIQIIGGNGLRTRVLSRNMDKSARFVSANGCADSHAGGVCKDAIGLSQAWKSDADWVVLLGVDNYVVTKQLEAALADMDPQEPVLLGLTGCSRAGCTPPGAVAVCGGGGQVFSRGALQMLFSGGEQPFLASVAQQAPACGMFGDVTNSRIAFTHGVKIRRVPWVVHPWRKTVSAMSADLNSANPALVFHYITPDAMRGLYDTVATSGRGLYHEVVTSGRGISLLSKAISSSLDSDEERYVAEQNKLRSASVGHVEFTLSNFSYELLKPM